MQLNPQQTAQERVQQLIESAAQQQLEAAQPPAPEPAPAASPAVVRPPSLIELVAENNRILRNIAGTQEALGQAVLEIHNALYSQVQTPGPGMIDDGF